MGAHLNLFFFFSFFSDYEVILFFCLPEMREGSTSRSFSYCQSEKLETSQSTQISRANEYQTRLIETEKLHIKACQQTTTLKRELDELKMQFRIQQRRLEYEARKSVLEEHKTALMLLRGRRMVDGGYVSGTGSSGRETNEQTHCRSPELTEVTPSGDSSPDITSAKILRLSDHAHLGVRKSDLDSKRVRTEGTSNAVLTPLLEVIPDPVRPLMVSVATSTDDLHDSEADVELRSDNVGAEEVSNWNIRENILCREEAEGRSRSVSPQTAEKKSCANVPASKGNIVYHLDEEVSKTYFL